jgi:deoxyadenosine/deoxycytidine kinase
MIVTIDGNIGSGKSTLLRNIELVWKKRCGTAALPPPIFLLEPIDEWSKITDVDGKTILQKLYQDPAKYSFSFQVMALQHQIKQLCAVKTAPLVVCERSIYTGKNIFLQMNYDAGNINEIEFQVYNLVFDNAAKMLASKNQRRIYIRSSPENTFLRKNERNRQGEEGVSIEYLKKCHEYHEREFLGEADLHADMVIDIDSYTPNTPEYTQLVNEIINWIINEAA